MDFIHWKLKDKVQKEKNPKNKKGTFRKRKDW